MTIDINFDVMPGLSGSLVSLAVEELAVDVGPELMNEEGSGIDTDIRAPSACGIAKGALGLWVVEVRDPGGSARANDFADVQGIVAGVVASNHDATHRVGCALQEASASKRVVACVFVGDGGHDELDHVVLNGLVDEGMPEVAAVPSCSLVKLRRGIRGLVNASDRGRQEDGRVVEAVVRRSDELVLYGLRGEMHIGADCSKVGEDAEDALGLLTLTCGIC